MANQKELCYLTIPEAALLLQSKQLSPVELTKAFLDRIEAVDGGLHSYVTLLPDSAIQEAQAAEKAIQAGEYRGPLHGIPIALKDLYDTAGIRTTAQSKVLEHRVPSQDATVVTRLKEAGTVLLGKLTMHEFALGGPPTSLFVPARNPWNPDHIPGGSSSGSGAAVAAGLCMGSLGSDTGGSIRGPAASCGIVGLKPTYGRVSRAGVLPLSWSLDHVGPMTWTVEDSAYMLQAIAGHDPDDPTSRSTAVSDYAASLTEDVRGLRVGVLRSYINHGEEPMDAETLAAFDAALAELAALGAEVVEIDIPSAIYSDSANSIIMLVRGLRLPSSQPAVAAGELRRDRASPVLDGRAGHLLGLRAGAAGAQPHPPGDGGSAAAGGPGGAAGQPEPRRELRWVRAAGAVEGRRVHVAGERDGPADDLRAVRVHERRPAGGGPAHGPPRRRVDGAAGRLRLPTARWVVREEAGVGGVALKPWQLPIPGRRA